MSLARADIVPSTGRPLSRIERPTRCVVSPESETWACRQGDPREPGRSDHLRSTRGWWKPRTKIQAERRATRRLGTKTGSQSVPPNEALRSEAGRMVRSQSDAYDR